MKQLQKAKYRVGSISIEGFKGFTNKQVLPLNGKHAFLFGANGSGKSSIIEAIRWCLFGLADRPEAEVRNAYYSLSECNVELELLAADGIWHVRRSLRPGAERSRLTILDPAGKEALQSSVFPNLARMGPREGTHIIFAANRLLGEGLKQTSQIFIKCCFFICILNRFQKCLVTLIIFLKSRQ